MTDQTLWNMALVWPMLNLLIAFYKAFTIIALPGAFGFAIIALTLVIRGGISPLTRKQLASAKKIAELKPQLDELAKKHKEDKTKLQQAQMQLYKDAGVNPAAGCLPLLIQMPIFIALYGVFNTVIAGSTQADFITQLNSILYHPAIHIPSLDLSFLGINLATKPNEWQTAGIGLLLIPVLTGVLQFIQTRQMMPKATPQQKGDKKGEEDTAAAVQKQMSYMMPVMIGYFAYSFPIGLALYWNTFSLFAIMQQHTINNKK